MIKKDGTCKMVPFPRACKNCSAEEKERWGCGFDKIEGTMEYQYTMSQNPWNKTCPQFFVAQPAVYSILSQLRDYKRGAIALNNLSSAHLFLLQIAEDESERHMRAQQDA